MKVRNLIAVGWESSTIKRLDMMYIGSGLLQMAKMHLIKVFDGKSLVEIWDTVTVEEIDGCDPTERLRDYIGENK